jgi:hypothetical protein
MEKHLISLRALVWGSHGSLDNASGHWKGLKLEGLSSSNIIKTLRRAQPILRVHNGHSNGLRVLKSF